MVEDKKWIMRNHDNTRQMKDDKKTNSDPRNAFVQTGFQCNNYEQFR